MPTYEDPPHPTLRHTSNTRIYLLPTHLAEIQRYDIRVPICTMATDGSRLPHSKSRYARSMLRHWKFVQARAKQTDTTCVARVEWRVLWRVEGVSPCIDIRIGGIGWNHGGSLIGYKTTKKQLKVKQSRQSRVCLRLSCKKRHNALSTNGRARGVRFLLDFSMYLFLAPNGPGVLVFGRRPFFSQVITR